VGVTTWAAPLSCQPPEIGEGIVPGGCPAVYVNSSSASVVLVPLAVVTVTSTVPVPAGAVAVSVVELLTVKVALCPAPKSTSVTPLKFVPLTATEVPAGPELGLTMATVGGGLT